MCEQFNELRLNILGRTALTVIRGKDRQAIAKALANLAGSVKVDTTSGGEKIFTTCSPTYDGDGQIEPQVAVKHWSPARGLHFADDTKLELEPQALFGTLRDVIEADMPGVSVLWDVHLQWTTDDPNNVPGVDLLRICGELFQQSTEPRAVVMVVPTGTEIPVELKSSVSVIDWPLPSFEVLYQLVRETGGSAVAGSTTRDAAEAARGLTMQEAGNAFARSMISTGGKLDPEMVYRAKKSVIEASGRIKLREPKFTFEEVGGLEEFKAWITQRKLAYSPAARKFPLPFPKGVLLGGIPGCGKSLCADAVGLAFSLPEAEWRVSECLGGLLGESQQNMREDLDVLAAIGQAVVFIDEVDKVFGGIGGSSGATDGGTNKQLFGMFLTAMQEQSGLFFLMTANDVGALPAEFTRKGRLDERFFIELPHEVERRAIWGVHITRRSTAERPRAVEDFDMGRLIKVSKDFTGSEIEEAVVSGMFAAFADGEREPTTADFVAACEATVPQSQDPSIAERLAKIRAWGKTGARAASSPPKMVDATRSRFAGLGAGEN